MLPNVSGGANWEGAAVDPETGILYVPSVTEISNPGLVRPDSSRSDMGWIGRGGAHIEGPFRLPLVKPPWGRLTAIDMNTGDHLWMKPNGAAPEIVRTNPKVQGLDLSQAGNPSRNMLLVTKTLLFAGEGSGMFNPAPGAGGAAFRAMDKKTGRLIFEMQLPGHTSGQPMTYMMNGRQYIVITVTNRDLPAEFVALTLGQ
jgi:quinoprotein glucose dehydrogenase